MEIINKTAVFKFNKYKVYILSKAYRIVSKFLIKIKIFNKFFYRILVDLL